MQDTVIVGEVEAGHAAAVRKSLKKAIQQINVSTFDIIELLHKVRKEHLYTEPTFADFVKTLGLQKRRAEYWERIGMVMETIGAKREEYEPIGVTKLRAITRLDPAATYTNPVTKDEHPMTDYIWGLMEMAPKKTSEELEQHVRVLLGETEENILTWLNIRLPKAAKDGIIVPAFERVRLMLGTKTTDQDGVAVEYGDGACLEAICADFLSGAETSN